jgi:hypothetical protein
VIRRFFELPDPIFYVTGMFLVGGLYFGSAAIIELAGMGPRLPLAPAPSVGLATSAIQVFLGIALLRRARWARPFAVAVPWTAYLLEWGLSKPGLVSVQAAELVVSALILPGVVLYCLYISRTGRQWFMAWSRL